MILEELGCHKIRLNKTDYRAALPDGDNPTSVQVNRDNLYTYVHTRSNFPEKGDIITLVEFLKGVYFTHAMHWMCEVCGYDYYKSHKKQDDVVDPCLAWLEVVSPRGNFDEDDELRRYDESVLHEFIEYPDIWLKDGVSIETQREFEVGFSVRHDRITIPVRDELGNLVGVKGRTIHDPNTYDKFIYIKSVPKTKVLYGLFKTYPFIKEKGEVVVVESEKGVQQLWSMGVKNSIAIGGHDPSLTQVMKLEKLGVDIVLGFDKGLDRDDIKKARDKFLVQNRLYSIWDAESILSDKESPTDKGREVWDTLYSKYKWKIK